MIRLILRNYGVDDKGYWAGIECDHKENYYSVFPGMIYYYACLFVIHDLWFVIYYGYGQRIKVDSLYIDSGTCKIVLLYEYIMMMMIVLK